MLVTPRELTQFSIQPKVLLFWSFLFAGLEFQLATHSGGKANH